MTSINNISNKEQRHFEFPCEREIHYGRVMLFE